MGRIYYHYKKNIDELGSKLEKRKGINDLKVLLYRYGFKPSKGKNVAYIKYLGNFMIGIGYDIPTQEFCLKFTTKCASRWVMMYGGYDYESKRSYRKGTHNNDFTSWHDEKDVFDLVKCEYRKIFINKECMIVEKFPEIMVDVYDDLFGYTRDIKYMEKSLLEIIYKKGHKRTIKKLSDIKIVFSE